jgi:response regulator RpfG family c-di-GMP phosphodiesterase
VRRRQTASRKPAKAQRAIESKRGSAPKAARNRRSSAPSEDTELTRLAHERDDVLEQLRLVIDTAGAVRMPTILITAYPDDRLRKRALNAGVICFLIKPFSEDDLLACIRSVVGSSEGRRHEQDVSGGWPAMTAT